MNQRDASPFIWGAILILAGVLFLARNLGVITGDVFRFWPLILLIIGAVESVRTFTGRRQQRSLTGPLLLIALGMAFLVDEFANLQGSVMVPLILIAIGLGILGGRALGQQG
jgi:hypothetical protein